MRDFRDYVDSFDKKNYVEFFWGESYVESFMEKMINFEMIYNIVIFFLNCSSRALKRGSY